MMRQRELYICIGIGTGIGIGISTTPGLIFPKFSIKFLFDFQNTIGDINNL